MSPGHVPGSIQDLTESVNALTLIVERLKPTLDHMAEAVAAFEIERENFRAELYAARARADEMGACCIELVEAVREGRINEARAIMRYEQLRTLVDEGELRRIRSERHTPPEGVRVGTMPPGWVDE